MRHIAFLRAVNVGGRKVEMARVRAAAEELGFERVVTFLASGNLFFDAPRTAKATLTTQLEGALRATFAIDVPVILRTVAEVESVCALEPFAGVEVTDDVRLLVHFLAGPAPRLDVPATSPKGGYELVHLTKGEAFLVVRVQDGRWPSERWPEQVLGVPSTGRFWHTTAKILAAAKK